MWWVGTVTSMSILSSNSALSGSGRGSELSSILLRACHFGHPTRSRLCSCRVIWICLTLSSAVLSSVFLNERLGIDGILGCILCVLGSMNVILHAPEEDRIETVEDVFLHFIQPAFMTYMIAIILISLYLIYRVRTLIS